MVSSSCRRGWCQWSGERFDTLGYPRFYGVCLADDWSIWNGAGMPWVSGWLGGLITIPLGFFENVSLFAYFTGDEICIDCVSLSKLNFSTN